MLIILFLMTILIIFYFIFRLTKKYDEDIHNLKEEVITLKAENEELREQNNIRHSLKEENINTNEIKQIILQSDIFLPKDFILTDDFSTAFNLIENTCNSVFITGKAGTGKSTFIDYYRKNTQKLAVFLAPTGVAALNIRGKTIHSLFKFPPQVITSDLIKDNKYKTEIKELFKSLNVIVVDEVSMARADIIEGMNFILQKLRENDKPFGGVQMVFVGDIYQLPPVIDKKEKVTITYENNIIYTGTLHNYFQRKYKGHYFFNSNAYKKANVNYFSLNKIFRQKDDNEFLSILNAIRDKNINNELLQQLNSRYSENIEVIDEKEIVLCTTNDAVNNLNKRAMNSLTGKPFLYEAALTGVFEKLIEEKDYPCEKILILKEKAQVMMVKNDKDGKWVNGTIGIIKKLMHDLIEVEMHGVSYTINKETWESIDYEYDAETDTLLSKCVGTFTQYPVKLAWAITIHKSQGKTFDKALIDMGNGAFAHGQTYVALSRCKTLEGIRLKRKIKEKDIILDDNVVQFINDINKTFS